MILLYTRSLSPPSRNFAALVPLQSPNDLLHLLVTVDAETLVFRDAGELDVLCVELLFHDLLKGAEGEGFGFGESEGSGSDRVRIQQRERNTGKRYPYLWYSLTSSACAPSEPEPMAFAS